MKTVSVVAQKGGTGKTTLCLAVACAAVRDGLTAKDGRTAGERPGKRLHM